MGGHNGNVRTFGDRLQQMAAEARKDVPIVGQSFVLEGWFLQLLITCRCEHPKPVLIVGQPGTAAGQCSSCKTIYTLLVMGVNAQGQPSFNVGRSTPPADADKEKTGEEDHG